ncbi:N-acetylmuramic acid 6-phosphate etherase [Longispora fulva]|uniref:N-acetylmuramic acid 6-phosphate etherase n=1 Tax=Longispora fulva TaxID=619741 RepID=A0A8J7KZB2_9ACTN|nr:N-acetylmuramic acid 6-phosphate etherase [Longispora fulva]MBG6140642.1 N-acetylmuramic acid 6-phosphate etherase [Longispora fulva]
MIRVTAPTEGRNPRTLDLDLLSTRDLLATLNAEDATVPGAVAGVLDALAGVVDRAVAALAAGGSVHYFGAGTSGRLGCLDAAEIPPTYGVPAGWFQAHLAGGPGAMWHAVENAEDDFEAGEAEALASVHPGDVVIGIAASGRTPYVLGALAASTPDCFTVLICSNPAAIAHVDVLVAPDTGPEPVLGSTRMKAATAQKLILNAFSTATMVRLGRVYSNLMVDLSAANAKLRGRRLSLLMEATGVTEAVATTALAEAGDELKVALVTLLAGVTTVQARAALITSEDQVRKALVLLTSGA